MIKLRTVLPRVPTGTCLWGVQPLGGRDLEQTPGRIVSLGQSRAVCSAATRRGAAEPVAHRIPIGALRRHFHDDARTARAVENTQQRIQVVRVRLRVGGSDLPKRSARASRPGMECQYGDSTGCGLLAYNSLKVSGGSQQ